MRLAGIARPLLELLPPETAHRAAIEGLKIAPPPAAKPCAPSLAVDTLGFLRQLIAVVPEEQLFERGRMADQAPDPELTEPAHRGF